MSYPKDTFDEALDLVTNDDAAALSTLLAKHANLARVATGYGWTLLHFATFRRRTHAARVLLKHDADPNAQTLGNYRTPLHFAAAHEDQELVHELIAAGANVNARDVCSNTPIHLACDNINVEVTSLLLSAGADANVKDHFYVTPLVATLLSTRAQDTAVVEEMVGRLLQAGADAYEPHYLGHSALDLGMIGAAESEHQNFY